MLTGRLLSALAGRSGAYLAVAKVVVLVSKVAPLGEGIVKEILLLEG